MAAATAQDPAVRALLRVGGIVLGIVWLVALLLAPASAHAQTAMSADEYADAVAAARTAIASAGAGVGSARQARTVAEKVADLVPEQASVPTAGHFIDVDGAEVRRLAARLERAADADARGAAALELDAHLASVEAALGQSEGAPADDPAVLATVLAELGVRGQSPVERWLSEAVEELVAAIERFVASLFSTEAASAGGRMVFYAFAGIAALVVLGLVYIVIRRWLRSTAPAPRAIGGVSLAEGPVVAAAEGVPADVTRYAEEAAAAGRYRDAVRALFGGAARTLVERGVITHARTRTSAELVADVAAARPAVRTPLGGLVALFEPAWYGHTDPGAEGYRSARACYDEVVSLAGGGAS
jgi:hypothetical protein